MTGVVETPVAEHRPLDRGWRERHIRGQADGSLPPGTIQMRHVDGTLAFSRLGRPRIWSEAVMRASAPRQLTSRARAKLAAKATERARLVEEAQRLLRQVQLGLRPPPGRLFAIDRAALLVIGPRGAIGIPGSVAGILEVMARGGRHPVDALLASGSWRDVRQLHEALGAVVPKLAAIGLRICRRKAGWRMAKLPSNGGVGDLASSGAAAASKPTAAPRKLTGAG